FFFACTISPSAKGKTGAALSAGAMSAVTSEFTTTARLSSGHRSQSEAMLTRTAATHTAITVLTGLRKHPGSSRLKKVATQTSANAREPLQAHSFIVNARAADCHQAGVGTARPALSRSTLRFAAIAGSRGASCSARSYARIAGPGLPSRAKALPRLKSADADPFKET